MRYILVLLTELGGISSKLTDIVVVLARYDERILAVSSRLNLMDKRWEELRQSKSP
jgi:hypothetical protein